MAILDMKQGNSYTPNIIRAYRGEVKVFERNTPPAWDYEYKNLVFHGDTNEVVQTEITPFSSSNINKSWIFEIKMSFATRSTNNPLQYKMYMVCNTTTNRTGATSACYWTGGNGANDDLTHSQLCIYDPGFGLGNQSSNSADCLFRMRGTDHKSTTTGTNELNITTLQAVDEGVAYNLITVEYDKANHLIYGKVEKFDSNDELISTSTKNQTDNSMQLSTSDLPVIIGGCYYDANSISIQSPTFNRVLGNSSVPVYMDFRFKYTT